MPLDVFGQIGLVMLIGLETKNAILIVEFGVEMRQKHGMSILESAKAASRERLRPILMTSFAFVMGVLPMARATGRRGVQPQLAGHRHRLRHRREHRSRPVRHPDLLRPGRASHRFLRRVEVAAKAGQRPARANLVERMKIRRSYERTLRQAKLSWREKLLRNSLAHRHPVHYKCLLRVIVSVIEKVERPQFPIGTFVLNSATVFSTKVT